MDKSRERKFVCKFCSKEFPSGKSLGGHIRIHTNDYSVDSGSNHPERVLHTQCQSDSESNSSIIDQEHKHMALSLIMMSKDSSFDNNSVTKSSSGEELKMSDQFRSAGYDSDTSGSDYFMNGPTKPDSFKSDEGGSKYEMRKTKRVFFNSPMLKKPKKKTKTHQCPICFRVFKSGQALGGHKRSHFIGNHQQLARHTIDLNLPAFEIDE